MSAFIPAAGLYFWTKCRPWDRVIGEFGGFTAEPQVVKQHDSSYSNEIILCVASDDRVIVGRRVAPYPQEALLNLPSDKWEFFPVGPEILAVYNLTSSENA